MSLSRSTIAKEALGRTGETESVPGCTTTLSVPTGDIQRASLQIRIRECEHDALRRFHWKTGEQSKIEVLPFTHALFGLALSPFLLGGVLEAHLDAWEEREPDMVVELI